MADDIRNIITLGIGAAPGGLLWFFTSGLESAAVIADVPGRVTGSDALRGGISISDALRGGVSISDALRGSVTIGDTDNG
jgi:hypothetical protein